MKNGIVVIGFMGSGKTTVARSLATLLGRPFVDLDELIRESEGRTAGQIIEADGEAEFRAIETRTLRDVLTQDISKIIAPGGGAWTVAENRGLITKAGAFTVWLDVPFDLCWRRIEQEGKTRPLASSREAAEELYFKRLSLYELADWKLKVSETDTADETAMKIRQEYSLRAEQV